MQSEFVIISIENQKEVCEKYCNENNLKIDNIKLLIKEGGKSGLWTNPDGLPKFLENIF